MFDYAALFTSQGFVSLVTLTALEIILGIDNIIFISIVSTKLPKPLQKRARRIGLSLALIMRVCLLFAISWIAGLKHPMFYIVDFGVTGRDLILFAGGVFLLIKTILEIVEKIQHKEASSKEYGLLTLKAAIIQIVFLDIVFSFDSILTAVGLVSNVFLMILAVVIAMIIMLVFADKVSDFINRHPTVKMLALAFLVVIGLVLTLEALHFHIEKAFIYSALAFSLIVELLNMAYRSQGHKKGNLHHKKEQEIYSKEKEEEA
ncbi:MAG: TerC family protein [Bacteroidota bacterium]